MTETKFDVSNIITDPDNNSQKFLVYGKGEEIKNNKKVVTGVIVALDFTTLHQRICQGNLILTFVQ